MATSTAHRDPRAGYTLVELLVVIGIVAVLAGLLLTGVFAVRRKVDAARCTANLLQLGMATRMYIADYHTLPLVWYGWPYPDQPRRPPSPPPDHDIAVALRDYVTDARILKCPSTRRHLPSANYRFNTAGSGLRLSQVRTPQSRALIMFCPFDRLSGYGHGKPNALFLDGHVKAYDSIMVWQQLWLRNDGSDPTMWPHE